jgi:hypothetical protein
MWAYTGGLNGAGHPAYPALKITNKRCTINMFAILIHPTTNMTINYTLSRTNGVFSKIKIKN